MNDDEKQKRFEELVEIIGDRPLTTSERSARISAINDLPLSKFGKHKMTDEQELELLRWMIEANLQLKWVYHFNKRFYSVIQGDHILAIKPTYIEAILEAREAIEVIRNAGRVVNRLRDRVAASGGEPF